MVSRTPFRACILSLLALTGGACSQGEARPPVMVLAVDGMEWSVAEPLLREGRMPNLQRLLDEGVGGVLGTFKPTFSPVLWTTVATGVTPDAHGILFFSELDLATGQPKPDGLPYTSECRAAPAIWTLADEAGKSVNSVAWWVSWPAEQLEHGRIVASYAAQAQGALMWKAGVWRDGLPELTAPASLAGAIAPLLAEGAPDGPYAQAQVAAFGQWPTARDTDQSKRRWGLDSLRDVNYRMSYVSDATHARIATHLLEAGVADLNLLYLGSLDVAGHLFWRYHEPTAFEYGAKIPAERLEHFGEHVRKAYEEMDRWIGEVLATLPPERVVMLVADHGMRAYNLKDSAILQSGHHFEAEPGVFVLSGAGVTRAGLLPEGKRRIGDLLDVAPTLCDLLGIPALKVMPGRSLRAHMSEAWRTAHQEPPRAAKRPYRAVQPPREPMADASAIFLDLMDDLGYIGDAEAPPVAPSDAGAPDAADEPK